MKTYTANDMRVRADYLEGALADAKTAAMLRQAADKIEHEATSEKSSAVGNAAAMREALYKVRRVLHCAIVADILKGDDVNSAFNEVNAALSVPQRNCDVGTAEEQQDRFREFCMKHFDARECGLGRSVAKCPAYRGDKIQDCSLWWAQMPYDEVEK